MDRRLALQTVGLAMPFLMTAGGAPARAATGSISEKTWRDDTLQYGYFSLKLSREILKRSVNSVVLVFAHLEIVEQTTAAEVLTQMSNPTPPALTDKQHLDFQALVASTTPDYTYASLQITGHENLLHFQEDYLATNSSLTSDPAHEALLLRSNVRQHLHLLKTIVLPAATAG